MANDLRSRLEAKEFPTASPGILVDDALSVFREWLESEAVKNAEDGRWLADRHFRYLAANLEPEGTEDE